MSIKSWIKQKARSLLGESRSAAMRLPKPMLTLEVQLCEHCNLNCACCDHFSPLAEPEFIDMEGFGRDMARLSELFCGEMQFIKLMGGEPLLNPRVTEAMRLARESFPVGEVLLVTNGLLLPGQPDSFWEACREYRVAVTPTKYPCNIDYARCEALAKAWGVEYIYYDAYVHGPSPEKTAMHRHGLDTTGRQDPRLSYTLCDSANNCLFLQRGRMYTCPVAATARHFNSYFGADMKLSPRDSIDIYQAKTGGEILEFLSKPIPFCRYCDKLRPAELLKWRPSERLAGEWTR